MAERTRNALMVMSLALNLGLIALILVGIGRVGPGFIAQPGVMAPAQIARALPLSERQKVLDVMAEHRGALQQKRRAARQARLQAFRAFAAQSYRSDDFARALDQVRAADSALEEEAAAQQRDVVNVLTPEERQRIAERVRARRSGPWWRRLFR